MATTLEPAELDLVAALQRAPRARTSQLADMLGVSTGTVRRRFAKLRDRALLCVVAQLPWSISAEGNPHHVWVSTSPGETERVAAAIAELDDARFVAVTTGQADVYCILHPPHRAAAVPLLTQTLPSIHGVLRTHSELGLHQYASGATWRLARLSPEQEQRLDTSEPTAQPEQPHRLSDEEAKVARALQRHGRASAADIARQLDMSASTAYRLTRSLLTRGVVRPRVEIEPTLLDYHLEAVLSLTTAPGTTGDIAAKLSTHPTARYVATVAGTSSVIHHGLFHHEDELAEFLSRDLAQYPGISHLEVSVVLRVLTRYWSPQSGPRRPTQ